MRSNRCTTHKVELYSSKGAGGTKSGGIVSAFNSSSGFDECIRWFPLRLDDMGGARVAQTQQSIAQNARFIPSEMHTVNMIPGVKDVM